MEFFPKQQAHDLIKQSKRILLVTRQFPSADSVACLLALGWVLKKLDKKVDIICNNFSDLNLSFLPGYADLKENLKEKNKFIISLDTKNTGVEQFSYDFDKENCKLNIYITPSFGQFNENNVLISKKEFGFDLIIVVGSPDLEKIGLIYDQNTEYFYKTPIINIDYQAANEHFGEVNIIDPTASSISEVLFSFIEFLGKDFLSPEVATCLLTGIITSSNSFQKHTTTPNSFAAAACLVAAGADREKIIKNIYKTKSLEGLKLWGRALARIKNDEEIKTVWTLIGPQDFKKTNTNAQHIFRIIDELLNNIDGTKIVFVLFEEELGKIKGLFKTAKFFDIEKLARFFNTKPERDLIQIEIKDKGLLEAERQIIKKIKQFQSFLPAK